MSRPATHTCAMRPVQSCRGCNSCDLLTARGHDAVTPADLGAHNLPDDTLIEIAGTEGRVVVTENASDSASAAATGRGPRRPGFPQAVEKPVERYEMHTDGNGHPQIAPDA